MASVPFWVLPQFSGGYWDDLWLGGVLLPGQWKVEVVKERSIEKKKQQGIDGNALQDKGYVGAVLKATGILWTAEQLEDFENAIPIFDPRTPGSARNPLDIYYPAAHLLSVFSVYVRKITIQQLSKQILTTVWDLEEWFPAVKPAKPSKTAKGFDGANNSGDPLNPKDFQVGPPKA